MRALVFVLACSVACGQADRQAVLMPGLGDVHHAVSTHNPEAQRFFDQGLALIYGFNHEEARRSFERAAALDPQCAMAWWGVALAVGPNYNDPDPDAERQKTAPSAIEKARSVSADATAAERDYIEALEHRFSTQADRTRSAVEYSDAMRELAKRYPDDLDAATLAAESAMDLHPWQLWKADGTPTEGTTEIVSMLEAVLKRDPKHIGANHFLIHAVEASPHPEQGLASAERLPKLAPAAGHLLHMPAHIYMRLGDYQRAVEANQQAAEADRQYIARFHVTGMYPAMYYSHNLQFLAVAASMEGRFAEANKAALDLDANIAPHLEMISMLEYFVPTRALVMVRFRRWDEILKLPQPPTSMAAARALWHFARGMAFAETRKFPEAEAQRQRMFGLMANVPEDAMLNLNRASDVLNLASHLLEGRIALDRISMNAAVEHFRAAAAIEDSLRYDEPPAWYIPAREALGRALMKSSRFEEAEQVFRDDLQHHPRNGRVLFGLWQSLRAQNKRAEAKQAEADFRAAWKNADVKLVLEDL